MTALSDLFSLASSAGTVVVGTGGGASAAFPLLSIGEASEVLTSTDGAGSVDAQERRRVITIDSWAMAGGESPAAVGALKEALRTSLVRRGQKVTITEMGGAARVLNAGGDVTGIAGDGWTTRPGYPVVSLEEQPEKSVGCHQFFRLRIESVEVGFVSGLVSLTRKVETTTDKAGQSQTRESGGARVKPGASAKAWLTTNVIDPAKTAAEGRGNAFTSRVTETVVKTSTGAADASAADYEWSETPLDFSIGGPGGTTMLDETDVTERRNQGIVVRTISGTVSGAGAYDAAVDREPTPGAGEVLTSRRVSQPSSIGGKVTYSYEVTTGVSDARMPGTVFLGFTQSVALASGGRQATAAVYDSGDPVPYFGPAMPWVYSESTDMQFTGAAPDPASVPAAFDAADLAGEPRWTLAAGAPGMRSMRLERVYMFDSEQAIPAAAELAP